MTLSAERLRFVARTMEGVSHKDWQELPMKRRRELMAVARRALGADQRFSQLADGKVEEEPAGQSS